ncbi:MAG: ABC transporter ATP-binding protein, partial [Azoarcus sp.]|nr:ABC transporter ATP-binding protein [Azoarcus sp.]
SSERTGRLGFNEKRELEALPGRIATLEAEEAALQTRLADPALYRDMPQEAPRLNARLGEIAAELDAALARWEELESRAG